MQFRTIIRQSNLPVGWTVEYQIAAFADGQLLAYTTTDNWHAATIAEIRMKRQCFGTGKVTRDEFPGADQDNSRYFPFWN